MSTSTLSANARTEPALQPAWRGFAEGPWTDEIDVRDFIQRNYTPYTGDASFLAGPTAAHDRDVGAADRDVPGRARARRLRRRPAHAVDDHVARARLHRPPQRADRRPADGRAPQARDHAQRRLPDGREGAGDLRVRARPDRRRDLHQVPQDPQRRRLRRLPAGRARSALGAPHHRPAGRLRARPDHRRLPPRRPVRRRRADRRPSARTAPSWTASARRRTSSATARRTPSRSARWASSRRWPRPTGTTSPVRRRPRRKPSSGCTSPTSAP